MSNTSNNVVSNGFVGSTVSVGYGAIPLATTPLTIGQVYTTNNTSLGGGSSGQFLTSGSNGTTWANSTVGTNPALTIKQTNPPELEVKGRMVINGRDLEERLDIIEKVLAIPERDVILEKKHPKLKKLFDEYINTLEKYKTFERIKGDYD
jgi:hypothetical protein